jgi:hypothetical protein
MILSFYKFYHIYSMDRVFSIRPFYDVQSSNKSVVDQIQLQQGYDGRGRLMCDITFFLVICILREIVIFYLLSVLRHRNLHVHNTNHDYNTRVFRQAYEYSYGYNSFWQ